MSTPSIKEIMISCAEDAVNFAKSNFDITLDYSNESIVHVEDIADKIYHQIPKNFFTKILKKPLSDEKMDRVCEMLGGYIGEVYRKNKGGEWDVNAEMDAIGVRIEDSWIFPLAKVHKRLTNGSEDNLRSYFSLVTDDDFMKKLGK